MGLYYSIRMTELSMPAGRTPYIDEIYSQAIITSEENKYTKLAMWQLITLTHNPVQSGSYSTIFAFRTLAWFFECLSILKLKSAIQTIIGLHIYYFIPPLDCFFYECQMMVNILFHNTHRLRNIPYRQGTVFEITYDFLPDGLFSFIAHTEYSGSKPCHCIKKVVN